MKEKAEVYEVAPARSKEDTFQQLGKIVLYALLGFLSAHTHVYGGLAPFGVGAAAAAGGAGGLFVYLSASVGYLLQEETVVALRYIAAIAAVAGVRFSFGTVERLHRHRLFAPLSALISTAVTGVVIASLSGVTVSLVLMIVGESVLAGGFAYFFSLAVETLCRPREERFATLQQQAAFVITVAVVLMSISVWEIRGISIGRILTVMLILWCAKAGKEPTGTMAGVVMGTALAFAGVAPLYGTIAYAFGGLIAGMFSRFGKLLSAASFVIGSLLVTLTADTTVEILIGAYEAVAGSLLFLVTPPCVDRYLQTLFCQRRETASVEGLRHSVSMRLEMASQAMSDVAGTVDAVSRKLAEVPSPDLGSLYFGVSDRVCRHCGLNMLCWERNMGETMDALNHLTPKLREQGMVTAEDIGGELSKRCMSLRDIADDINRGYAEYRLREGAWRRLGEIRAVVTDQFAGMAELLSEFSENFDRAESMDAEASLRIRQICEAYKMQVEQVVCTIQRDRRMRVDILASDRRMQWRQREWLQQLGEACGREWGKPQVTRFADTVQIRLTEKPAYRVRLGTAQLCCEQERLCGDAFESFSDVDGRYLVVLSDGMGSGGRAAVDGAMAAGLTARLLKAGLGEDSVLRMVNSALMVKSGDESLATLDILSVDCFTGSMRSLKAGAAASLLYSRGRISRLDNASLPVGILRDIAFQKQSDTLVEGDVLLMMSDGVLSDGIAWVEELLQTFDAKKQSLQGLAEQIALQARERQQGKHQDDITVLAVRLEKVAGF